MHQSQGTEVGQCVELSSEESDSPHTDTNTRLMEPSKSTQVFYRQIILALYCSSCMIFKKGRHCWGET